jgi:tRNA G18 (ribose-2'-O)-methylase SpoU
LEARDAMNAMSNAVPIPIDSLEDPRVAIYRNLKDREVARLDGRFIAESEHVVRRLLASDYTVESVMVCRRRAGEMSAVVPATVPMYVVPDPMVHQIVGFKFHSGVMACGRQKENVTLDRALPRGKQSTIVICPELSNNENLGSLIRIAAAFGADAMILGERSCDPLYRLSIRVSMGTVFSLPIVRSNDIVADMGRLRREWSYELIATVLDEQAEPLATAGRGDRVGLIFGNEAQGLPEQIVAACDRRVTIPMQRGTDSLNVSVAAGIFLYHFTRN